MQKTITLKLLPGEAANSELIRNLVAAETGANPASVNGFHITRRSIDARGKTIWVNLQVLAFVDEPVMPRQLRSLVLPAKPANPPAAIIIGAGPAGLFAALQMLQLGIKPIIIERGKEVRARRRDLAALNKEGVVNPESNYCFGEGGAGTYSDGKLYTRSSKRGDVQLVLEWLHQFGASESILYESHPHIGTNKLPHIITAIRLFIEAHGGEVHFGKKLGKIITRQNQVAGIETTDGQVLEARAVVLATGHSARDVFGLLHHMNLHLEAKPFALGVRVEHPQTIIDRAQYHCDLRDELLPPAAYSLVHQVDGRGVFSFCMCPGGIIAPAATAPGEIVVNGWSPSKRNNPFANSGMVVEIRNEDLLQPPPDFEAVTGFDRQVLTTPLGMMHFQQYVEQKAFAAGGGNLVAPAQTIPDFVKRKISGSLPDCSYLPGLQAADLYDVLPPFVHHTLAEGFRVFGKKIKGYFSTEAVAVATESRTSSPVRVPRNAESLQHPQLPGLFPCGEGAGYAGGIVSAAMDGQKVAHAVAFFLGR